MKITRLCFKGRLNFLNRFKRQQIFSPSIFITEKNVNPFKLWKILEKSVCKISQNLIFRLLYSSFHSTFQRIFLCNLNFKCFCFRMKGFWNFHGIRFEYLNKISCKWFWLLSLDIIIFRSWDFIIPRSPIYDKNLWFIHWIFHLISLHKRQRSLEFTWKF